MLKLDSNWDEIREIVIIGYGMAGAAAAMTAHDEGAEVLILDKMARENFHTNSSMSSGVVMASTDANQTARYLRALSGIGLPEGSFWTEPDITDVWAEYAADNARWLQQLGGTVNRSGNASSHSSLDGAESVEYSGFAGSGLRMMRLFYAQIDNRRIEVRFGTKAEHLLTNLSGEVIGVRAQNGDGKQVDIGATRGVLLASGGFEHNDRLKVQYLKVSPVYFNNPLTCTGDGVAMAMEVGADLWHMTCATIRTAMKPPELPWSIDVDLGGKGWKVATAFGQQQPSPCGYMLVDKLGQRFTKEVFHLHGMHHVLSLFDSQRMDYPRIPCYWIFDQKRIDSGAIPNLHSGPTGPHQLYHWSPDNSAEIEKGWIISAKTVGQLAGKIGLPADAVRRTIASYNRSCAAGRDTEFNRPAWTLAPLDNPPYYACQIWPGGVVTRGGPRRNARAQILNLGGKPIGGLYGAGELGGVTGLLYPSPGSALSECIAFGRIAGQNLGRTTPRSIESKFAGVTS